MNAIERAVDVECHDARPLAVVVVTYNSAEVLPGLLNSLQAGLEGVKQHEIVVVDNDSRDNCVDLAVEHPVRPKVIRAGYNGGYAAAINIAAAQIAPDADMLIVNPDIRLHPGAAKRLHECLNGAHAGIVVPKINHTDGRLAHSLRREPSIVTAWSESLLGGTISARIGTGEIVRDPRLYKHGGSIQWATGAVLMVSARVRTRVGSWDESFFLYSEEVDYMRRVRECGFSVEYVPEAEAVHIGGEYQENPFLSGLMTANRIRDYGRRHGLFATQIFRLGLAVGAAVRAGQGPARRAELHAAFTSKSR